MTAEPLSEREQRVLEAVILSYVESAEPAGSSTVARRFALGISPATIRNTMSDLEEKGFLFHPHTSAGRVPTDRAYRRYVDTLMTRPRAAAQQPDYRPLRDELSQAEGGAIEQVIRRAAQVLGLLAQEWGVAIAPQVGEATLERLDLVPLAENKLLLVLVLRSAGVRTVCVDVPASISEAALSAVMATLNERLAGLPLREICATLPQRLRDTSAADASGAGDLLNIVLQSAPEWLAAARSDHDLHLGHASVLAEQPEFSTGERLRGLIELTERRDLLKRMLGERLGGEGLQVTIGVEHGDPALAGFTVVTSQYHVGTLRGVIGVVGPTRMPYDRVLALVEGTSSLVSRFLS